MAIRKVGLSIRQSGPGTRLANAITCIVLLVNRTTGVTVMPASVTTHHHIHSGVEYSSCQTLDIVRRYANTDGIYERTHDTCSDYSSDPYYERIQNPSPMYFYPLKDGTWGVFYTTCSANTYGVTQNATSVPWTTSFAANHLTTITCVDLEQNVNVRAGLAEGVFNIPYFQRAPQLSHRYDVTLPDTVTCVNFTVEGQCGSTESRIISIDIDEGHSRISLVASCDLCQVTSESCREARYDFQPNAVYRGFQIDVNVSRPANEGFSILYTLDHMEATTRVSETTPKESTRAAVTTDIAEDYNATDLLIVSTSRDAETTMPGEFGDYFTGSGDDYEVFPSAPENDDVTRRSSESFEVSHSAPEHDVTTQSSQSAVLSTQSAKDPCAGRCMFHQICVSGLCVCPLPASCLQAPSKPMCVDGVDFPSECHVNVEVCRQQASVAVYAGSCQDREDSTLPAVVEVRNPTNATLLEDDLLILIVVISLLVLLIIILIIIFFICRRRRKRGKLTVSATQQQQKPLIDEKPKPRVLVEKKKALRTSSSTSENYRASPKPRHQMLPADKKPEAPIDPDRFSLSGCITPLHEMTDPFETFKPGENKTGVKQLESEPQRPASAVEQNVLNKKIDGDSGIAEEGVDMANGVCVSADRSAPVAKRENSSRHTASGAAESAVYEIQPHEGATIELDVLTDPFEDDTNVITQL